MWFQIPQGAWLSVCCYCCVWSGRDLCDELITRPEESYRLCCVVVCDLETSRMRRPWPTGNYRAQNKQINSFYLCVISLSELSLSYINKLLSFLSLCDGLNILTFNLLISGCQNFIVCVRL